ncbi:c-type cytochrome [Marixanthomonas spongiae]|uniref:Cytochrome C n=1 Tax=Marixanthomonas spongiae TaxID=2174845 RepID=A0A2U0I0I9_9FLAO|nr:cytochrome c [Marixanthomonas spongiae]PVW14623.1 cytochrome C [Marixanthomonas spongiae]
MNILKTVLVLLGFISTTACNNSKKEKTIANRVVAANQDSTYILQQKQDKLAESKKRGSLLYTDFCMQCHQANGKGVPNAFPPLAGSNWLTEKREETIHAVKYGQSGEIEVNGKKYNGIMTAMGLSNKEVADVLNYVMNSWGNTQEKMVTEEEVANVEK